jgi:hypothetical protein
LFCGVIAAVLHFFHHRLSHRFHSGRTAYKRKRLSQQFYTQLGPLFF